MKARLIAALTHHLQTPFVLLILACLVAILWISQGFSLGARLFPTAVASLGILLAVLELGARRSAAARRRRATSVISPRRRRPRPSTLGVSCSSPGWRPSSACSS